MRDGSLKCASVYLEDELKQFRGEVSIRSRLSPPPTACCTRPGAKQSLKMEEPHKTPRPRPWPTEAMQKSTAAEGCMVKILHVGLVYLCFSWTGSSNGLLKVLHAQEQGTDQSVSIKYASSSLSSSWFVWGDRCALTRKVWGTDNKAQTQVSCTIS